MLKRRDMCYLPGFLGLRAGDRPMDFLIQIPEMAFIFVNACVYVCRHVLRVQACAPLGTRTQGFAHAEQASAIKLIPNTY